MEVWVQGSTSPPGPPPQGEGQKGRGVENKVPQEERSDERPVGFGSSGFRLRNIFPDCFQSLLGFLHDPLNEFLAGGQVLNAPGTLPGE